MPTNRITVIIPRRETDSPEIALKSLSEQTYKGFEVIVVPDQGKGAPWARNEGFKKCDTEFVLFSDNDIKWESGALDSLLYALEKHPKVSYSYGRYQIGDLIIGHALFDPRRLLMNNYISTMSLIRSKDFIGFDESLKRFQDWDLWLTMTEQGKRGVYCNDLIFSTEKKQGISEGGMTTDEALGVLNKKHNLNLPSFDERFV